MNPIQPAFIKPCHLFPLNTQVASREGRSYPSTRFVSCNPTSLISRQEEQQQTPTHLLLTRRRYSSQQPDVTSLLGPGVKTPPPNSKNTFTAFQAETPNTFHTKTYTTSGNLPTIGSTRAHSPRPPPQATRIRQVSDLCSSSSIRRRLLQRSVSRRGVTYQVINHLRRFESARPPVSCAAPLGSSSEASVRERKFRVADRDAKFTRFHKHTFSST